MSGLSDEDRKAITTALMPHAWDYPDSFDDCGAYVNSQGAYVAHLVESLAPAVVQIVAAHITAERNRLADEIEARRAVCAKAHGRKCIGANAYQDAAAIVRPPTN